MIRQHRLFLMLLLGFCMFGGFGISAQGASSPRPDTDTKRRPNIVLIVADDLGWRDLRCMGSDFYQSPRIDRLAEQGMIFTQAYANAPNCQPSRACLMTGSYTPRHGVHTVGSSQRGPDQLRKLVPVPNTTALGPEFTTVAEILQDAGYTTATLGKWHLGPDPTEHGFDINVGGSSAGHPRSYFRPFGNVDMPEAPPSHYLTDALADQAVDFIETHANQSFFLYLPHYAVHTPLQAPEFLISKYQQKPPGQRHDHPVYAAMIERLDSAVGRVLDALDEHQLTKNTLVIFTSDNGGYGPATSMAPLRGSKGMLYEGGIRVPMIVRWPGHVEPGSVSDEPVIGLDLYPTLLDAAGVPVPEGVEPDGVSLLPLLIGATESLDREALFWHFPAYLQADRSTSGPYRTTPVSVIRQGDWKLLEFFENGRLELYNLANDLGEIQDLSDAKPDRTRRLHQRLKDWRSAVDAPVPTRRNPKFDPEARRRAEQEDR